MSMDTEQDRIWYREPGIWMVITPLIVVVIVSMIMVSAAIYTADDVVSDDYYKEGRMHNKGFDAENKARELGLIAQLTFNKDAGEIQVELKQTVVTERLAILLSHPAQAEYDYQLNLQKVGEKSYRAKSNKPFSGRWNLRLIGSQNQRDLWRLDGTIDFSLSSHVNLESQ